MFKRLIKNKKAQNTAEYAILISLVVAGIIAMQTYAQRALQARVRDASIYLTNQTGFLGNTAQYEPYYAQSNFVVATQDSKSQILQGDAVSHFGNSSSTREALGTQVTTYDASQAGIVGGL